MGEKKIKAVEDIKLKTAADMTVHPESGSEDYSPKTLCVLGLGASKPLLIALTYIRVTALQEERMRSVMFHFCWS